MKLDENLYIQIYVVAREGARKHGFDIPTAEHITHETALELLDILADKNKLEKTGNWSAVIRGILIRKFADQYEVTRKKKLTGEDFDSLTDTINESMNRQARSFIGLIDDYITRYPRHFTWQNKKLWKMIKQQPFTIPEMIALMDTNKSGFDTAKSRLVKRIMAIYAKIATSNLI